MFNIHYFEKTSNQLEYEEANEGCKIAKVEQDLVLMRCSQLTTLSLSLPPSRFRNPTQIILIGRALPGPASAIVIPSLPSQLLEPTGSVVWRDSQTVRLESVNHLE